MKVVLSRDGPRELVEVQLGEHNRARLPDRRDHRGIFVRHPAREHARVGSGLQPGGCDAVLDPNRDAMQRTYPLSSEDCIAGRLCSRARGIDRERDGGSERRIEPLNPFVLIRAVAGG